MVELERQVHALRAEMKSAVAELAFEQASVLRDEISYLQKLLLAIS